MSLSRYLSAELTRSVEPAELLQAMRRRVSVREKPLRTHRLSVDFVADFTRRYPGETLVYFVRVRFAGTFYRTALEVRLPQSVRVLTASCVNRTKVPLPDVRSDGSGSRVLWEDAGEVSEEDEFEFRIEAQIAPGCEAHYAEGHAEVVASDRDGNEISDREEVRVAVSTRAHYARFLPAIFEHDPVLNQFLMLCESFWLPIEQQVGSIHHYFDPAVTPEELLPWLASWLGQQAAQDSSEGPAFAVEGREPSPEQTHRAGANGSGSLENAGLLTEQSSASEPSVHAVQPQLGSRIVHRASGRQLNGQVDCSELLSVPTHTRANRDLLREGQSLRQSRGTRRGLQRYLEIVTGATIHVIEHRAENLVLGSSHLGQRRALGRDNRPHSFTVHVIFDISESVAKRANPESIERCLETMRQRLIPIIDSQKPVHTTYTLTIDFEIESEIDPVDDHSHTQALLAHEESHE